MISVGLADHQFYFRKGIAGALSAVEDIQICWEVTTARDLEGVLCNTSPQIVLLASELKGLDVLSFLENQQVQFPEIKSIVFISSEDVLQAKELLDAGAKAILSRETDQGDIESAIRAVMEVDIYFNELVSRALLTKLRRKTLGTPFDTLRFSKNEIRVLELLADGYKTQEIATRIFLSEKSVENIRHQLKLKTGVGSSTALVVYALRNRLIR